MATPNKAPLTSPILSYKKNQLHVGDVSIAEVAAKHPTPFFLYDQRQLLANYQEFYGEALAAGLPSPLVCFALKANPNREILRLLADEGAGADLVSGGELRRALEAGIPPERIMFSGVGKTAAEIELALQQGREGVFSFNVESLEELELINQVAARVGRTARVCFRLNPMVEAKTHKHISTGNKTHKFGLLQKDVLKAVRTSKYWKHAKLVGLSVHIGSQLLDLKATKKAIHVLGTLARKLPHPPEFLDVGGGLGVAYHPKEMIKLPSIATYMALVAQSLEESFFAHYKKRPTTRVAFEPGRRIVAQTGVLVMSVLRTKVSEKERFMVVDGGMNDFMRPTLYDAFHALLPVKKTSSKAIPTHVVGPICETSDCFATGRPMPPLKSGELLVLADAGAYGYSMGSNYNLRGRPAELLLTGEGDVRVINPAQAYEELR